MGTPACSTCDRVKTGLSLIFTAAMAAAIVGAYLAHTTTSSPTFGSVEGSLSLLALVLTLTLWTTNLDCSRCPSPKYQQWIVFTILIIATAASLVGLYQAHLGKGALTFGTMDGSLAILTFAVVSTTWAKHVQALCGSCSIRQS